MLLHVDEICYLGQHNTQTRPGGGKVEHREQTSRQYLFWIPTLQWPQIYLLYSKHLSRALCKKRLQCFQHVCSNHVQIQRIALPHLGNICNTKSSQCPRLKASEEGSKFLPYTYFREQYCGCHLPFQALLILVIYTET